MSSLSVLAKLPNVVRFARRLVRFSLVLSLATSAVHAQTVGSTAPQTREESIAAERGAKLAELWPERQNAMVDIANGLMERGLKEGLESGKGSNGFQFVLGGMRAAQGMSGGVGYRRSDLFAEQLGFRGTARGTLQGAYMFDVEFDFRGLRTERTYFRWYSRLEHSPRINYFGLGNTSLETNRSSYRYNDLSSDFSGELRLGRRFHFGATGGILHADTAASGEDGVAPIDEAFTPESLPGFNQYAKYARLGLFAYFDSRDSLTGPRSGGLLGVRYREYWDAAQQQFALRQSELEVQKYFPYFNRARVLALRGSVVMSFPKSDNDVPLYLRPTLGGSDELRGYVPYRFRDYHSVSLTAEHRWHAFSFLDMSLFADAGKVVRLTRHVDPTHLHYSGGVGFRVRLRSAIISRIDLAGSSEGFRMIWTFSDIFNPRY